MKAYYYNEDPSDQRENHDSGRAVSTEYLSQLGVLYHNCPSMSSVDKIASERSYRNRDEIVVSPETMGPLYEEKVKMFFNEHLHEDEEIRYIIDGNGFFDVRNSTDEWVRIRVEKDDMIILPSGIAPIYAMSSILGVKRLSDVVVGIFHRFTTDIKNYIKAMRLFKDEPKWTPLNRAPELDKNPHRKTYLQDTSAKAGMMT